ncbi:MULTISPECIES: type VII secretion protein EssB [Listeria]|uniref:type VII secretion protein EssB n=1 Tax=Listeria TaxID=1637 RepID=UPI000B589B63|nr:MULTISPECIES: type VII secretion protein EssB [Listeria]
MKNKIEIGGVSYEYNYEDTVWSVSFTESRTRIKDDAELEILAKPSSYFVPVEMEHANDTYTFNYTIAKETYSFDELKNFERKDSLRALRNVAELEALIGTRFTFFLHPSNIIFDENLMPKIVHRGLKGILEPYDLTRETFFKQYQSLIVAMFQKKYDFDNLYAGSVQNARGTAFLKAIVDAKTTAELVGILDEAFQKEKESSGKKMALVPKKTFRTYKGLAVGFIIAAVLLAAPLIYLAFMKVPYQNELLTANEDFLKTDYSKVIADLENEDPEKLPQASKYILSYSYLQGEKLDDKKKENIMKNLSLKSDEQALLYWIYNGRGDFDESLDAGQRLQDDVLITYALTKQLEEVRADKTLSGDESVKKQAEIEAELKKYMEKLEGSDKGEQTDEG